MSLQSDSLSNQNITAYLLTSTYTADASRELTAFVALTEVAGGGDYSIYVTRQLAGAGAAYMLPITTFAVPVAQTAIAFQSGKLNVETGDVLKTYVKGLGADTATPDIVTQWYDLVSAELAKVPKSDSTVSWNVTALAAINAEVTDALNTSAATDGMVLP